jgi:mRNA interferase HigB
MHVLSKKPLRKFWTLHPDAERPLRRWLRIAAKADWHSFADVRATYAKADQVDRFTVFNIGGNKYRLIAIIHFNRGKLFVRNVLTHKEYDLGQWKDD